MPGMMKHRSPRKISQASLRTFTKPPPKPVQEVKPEEIFCWYTRSFTPGKKYYICDKGNYKPEDNESHVFIYQGKHGKHHIFTHFAGGWLTTRTDQQLIGKKVEEVIL